MHITLSYIIELLMGAAATVLVLCAIIFSRTFRDIEGLSPTQFRQQQES